MKRLTLSALLCCAALLFALPAVAGDREIAVPNENPPSTAANQQPRSERLAFGTWMLQALNLSGNSAGIYSNLAAIPATGLFVTINPAQSGTLGAVYQVAEDDSEPIPVSCPATPTCAQLAADSTLIVLQALEALPSQSLGPLTAPGSGSVFWLIEAQVQTIDTNSQSVPFILNSGTRANFIINGTRTDEVVYNLKSGTPASSPSQPTVDAGWIPIAYVQVSSGVTQIATSMITMAPGWAGFAFNGSGITLSGFANPTPQPGNAAITGQFTAGSFSGNGSLIANLNPSNLLGPVPQALGGTGIPNPTWLSAGGSGNLTVTPGGPNQTVDTVANPSFTSVSATTLNTSKIVPSPSSSPIAVPAPGMVVDTLSVQPGAVPSASPCPTGGGNVCAQNFYGGSWTVGNCLYAGPNGQAMTATGMCGLASSPLNSITGGSNIYLGGTTANPVIDVTPAPSFSGGVAVDGNASVANGLAGGNASNAFALKSLASGQAYAFNINATGCGSSGIASLIVSGSTVSGWDCSGNFKIGSSSYGNNASIGGSATVASGIGTDGNAAPSHGILGGTGSFTFELTGINDVSVIASSCTFDVTQFKVASTQESYVDCAGGYHVGSTAIGSTSASINGPISSALATGGAVGPVPPCYTPSGNACASTFHIVKNVGALGVTTAGGSCAPQTFCALSTNAGVIFPSGQVFNNGTPTCAVSTTASLAILVEATNIGASGFNLTVFNAGSAAIANGTNVGLSYSCSGI